MNPEEKRLLLKEYWQKYEDCKRLGLKEEADHYKTEYYRVLNWDEIGFIKLNTKPCNDR